MCCLFVFVDILIDKPQSSDLKNKDKEKTRYDSFDGMDEFDERNKGKLKPAN